MRLELPLLLLASALNGPAPLWGDLEPGPEAVGFRVVYRHDRARTWRRTWDTSGGFSPDTSGRPVLLHVWHPARLVEGCEAMTFGRYVELSAPEQRGPFGETMRRRARDEAASGVPPARLSDLLATPMRACLGAPAVTEDAPLVLYAGGVDAAIDSNVLAAEYLASHGYVVASVSLLGASDGRESQSQSPADIEATVRDLEYASAVLQELGFSRATRVAVVGHSLGGVAAMVFAARNGNTLAAIALDGTYGFAGSSAVLSGALGYEPRRMRAAVLDLRRAEGEQQARLELAPLRGMRHARRDLVALRAMHHSDFTSFAEIADRFGVPVDPRYSGTGWDRRTGRRGHELAVQLVGAFLDERLLGQPRARLRFQELARDPAVARLETIAAVPAAPPPEEAAALLASEGLERVRARFRAACGEESPVSCVDAVRFNAYGYELLGRKHVREAVGIFELVAWAHPSSSNAQDSLADGYSALGEREKAQLAIRRAIELAPGDATIDPSARDRMIAEWTARLKHD